MVFCQIVVQKVFEIFAPSPFLIPPPAVFNTEANACRVFDLNQDDKE